MRSLERQGIEDRLPQRHLGPAAAAMERKGTVTEMGEKNREILSINRLLGTLKRAEKKLGDKIAELMAAIHHQEVLENPQTHSLTDVILSYRAMREAGRETWGKYARDKAGIRDLQDMSKMIILMKETGITTVEDLALRLSNTRVQLELMQGDVRSNNQVIRDIDDFFTAIKDYASAFQMAVSESGTQRFIEGTWQNAERRPCILPKESFQYPLIHVDLSSSSQLSIRTLFDHRSERKIQYHSRFTPQNKKCRFCIEMNRIRN